MQKITRYHNKFVMGYENGRLVPPEPRPIESSGDIYVNQDNSRMFERALKFNQDSKRAIADLVELDNTSRRTTSIEYERNFWGTMKAREVPGPELKDHAPAKGHVVVPFTPGQSHVGELRFDPDSLSTDGPGEQVVSGVEKLAGGSPKGSNLSWYLEQGRRDNITITALSSQYIEGERTSAFMISAPAIGRMRFEESLSIDEKKGTATFSTQRVDEYYDEPF